MRCATSVGINVDNYIYNAFRHGLINIWLLKMIGKKRTYPYALVKTLKASKSEMLRRLSRCDIYNTLNALEKRGLVCSRPVFSGAKMRKEYRLTPRGRRLVREADSVRQQILDEFNG